MPPPKQPARALNLFSRGFDPLEALRQPSAVPLPAPGARLYNNLGEWPLRGLGEDPYLDIREQRELVMPKEQARREAIQQTIKIENTRRKEVEDRERVYLAQGGLLGDIADATALIGLEGGGPLAGMAAWRKAGSRVCVSMRSTGKGSAALRGNLKGLLISFDRHFNLVLGDVEETYQTAEAGERSEWKTRRMRQLFVRGDNVIVVARIPS